ncbi:MAG: sulfatase [Verrucomicrobiaceae bacterium]|nr:sulfatase [Verrucomicrobiaceae bacterium]
MHPHTLRTLALLAATLAALCRPHYASAADATAKPNFIFILCDNLGYGDIACFNPATKHRTPRLDQMAAEGRKFSSFYSCSGVCTPSRASLMTGCYPRRVNMHVSDTGGAVLQPVAAKGLHPAEDTIADVLKRADYATACIGKWHLGDQPEFLPTRQGFDSFFGIPYSEDMVKGKLSGREWPELPLMRDEKVVEAPVDARHLTRRLTEEAVKFIEANRERQFFLYFPEAAPGSRAVSYPGPQFEGRSANGLYGDAIEELDWSAGQILDTLKRLGLDENTIVVWTSDNGAVSRNPPQGSNAPWRGMGYSTTEGGMRMPCIIRWPHLVPARSVCDDVCTMMDFLPTFAQLAGAPLPDKPIDGQNMRTSWLATRTSPSPYDETGFFYYHLHQLQAVRAGDWKLYLPLDDKIAMGRVPKRQPQALALFDVRHDLHEDHEASAMHPEIVRRLTLLAGKARSELGDGAQRGTGQREAGHVDAPRPQTPTP